MIDGNVVRARILSLAVKEASTRGFGALSLGDLARNLELPRSGLAEHFANKESLQLGVLEQAAAMFLSEVIEARPPQGGGTETGEARLRFLFKRWIAWSRSPQLAGGCPFVHASSERDALPPRVSERLKETLDKWSAVLAQPIEEGRGREFRSDTSAEQVVFELYGLYLSHHFWHWSMKDARAGERSMAGFERLISSMRISEQLAA